MVKLEEVKDAELNAPQPGPASDEFEDDADFTDTGKNIPSFPFLCFGRVSSFYSLGLFLPFCARKPDLPSCCSEYSHTDEHEALRAIPLTVTGAVKERRCWGSQSS